MQNKPTDGVNAIHSGMTVAVNVALMLRKMRRAVNLEQNEMTKFVQSKKKNTCGSRMKSERSLERENKR